MKIHFTILLLAALPFGSLLAEPSVKETIIHENGRSGRIVMTGNGPVIAYIVASGNWPLRVWYAADGREDSWPGQWPGTSPEIAAGNDGSIHAVLDKVASGIDSDPAARFRGVWYAKAHPDGGWSDPLLINNPDHSQDEGEKGSPQVMALNDGAALVAWWQPWQSGFFSRSVASNSTELSEIVASDKRNALTCMRLVSADNVELENTQIVANTAPNTLGPLLYTFDGGMWTEPEFAAPAGKEAAFKFYSPSTVSAVRNGSGLDIAVVDGAPAFDATTNRVILMSDRGRGQYRSTVLTENTDAQCVALVVTKDGIRHVIYDQGDSIWMRSTGADFKPGSPVRLGGIGEVGEGKGHLDLRAVANSNKINAVITKPDGQIVYWEIE